MLKMFVFVLLFCELSCGAFSFGVFRSLQWKSAAGEHGSRRASLFGMSASLVPAARKAFVAEWTELLDVNVEELAKQIGALIVVLPSVNASLSATDVSRWKVVERQLVHSSVGVPVFFCLDGSDIASVKNELSRPTSLDAVELALPGPIEAPFVAKPEIALFHGWLQGISGAADMLPTIAIVSHYDTLASAALLPGGANAASGVAATLELARLFSKLYHQPRNRVAVNFLFVITGGSRQNFAGSEAWASQLDKQLLERIDLALCLESIGQSSNLFLHYSRPPKTQKIKSVYDAFVDNAKEMGINLSLRRRKINVAAESYAFEHEVFAKKNVLSVTLSGDEEPNRGPNSLDRTINLTALTDNIAFIAESLFKHSFGFSGRSFRAFEGSLSVDKLAVAEWMRLLQSESRVEFTLNKNRGSSISLDLIRDRLSDYTERFVNHTIPIREGLAFRDLPAFVVVTASLTRSAFFHVGLVLAALLYLVASFALFEYLAKGKVDFKGLLADMTNKRKK